MTWKLDSTIVFNLYFFVASCLVLGLLRGAALLVARSYFFALSCEVTLVRGIVCVVEPETDVVDVEVESS